jgi:hypothetical protein
MRGKRNGDEISAAMTGDDLLETIAQNWVQCAASGIPLETRNNTYFFEETYSVSVQREGGLGLILGEVWASPGFDDEGLVLVEEVVRGSNAANAGGIAVGDTILGVSGTRGVASGVATEGKNWDATIEALTSVEGDAVDLVMKRLVRRERIDVHVTASDGTDLGSFSCPAGANLRMEFLRRQLPMTEIYDSQTMRFDAIGNSGSNCGGEGSCGTCLVAITQGFDLVSPAAGTEAKALAKQGRPTRWRWSCRTVVGSENRGGNVRVQLRPQIAFADEQTKTEGLGVL